MTDVELLMFNSNIETKLNFFWPTTASRLHLTELLHITAWIVWNGNVFDN